MTLVPIPRARKRQRQFYLTARDQAAFSAAVKEAYPDLVFGQMYSDRALRYFDSMELVDNSRLSERTAHAWRQPPGWEPDWALRYPDIPEIGYVVANLPDSHFFFDSTTDKYVKDLGNGRKRYTFKLSAVFAVYDHLDPDTRRFIEKVYRLLRKLTTNKFLVIEPESGRIVRETSDYFESAGHDVLLSCRKNNDHFVTCRGRDADTGAPLFYAPREDWSPPAWLVELDSKTAAESGNSSPNSDDEPPA